MPEESIQNPRTSDTNFSPGLIDECNQCGRLKFKGICLKQDSVSVAQNSS